MAPIERMYDLLLTLSRPLLPAARLLPPKVAEAVEGRRTATRRAQSWAESGRAGGRPLVWFHAASAGELGGAVPVIRLLRNRRPELQVAITVSSPSGLSSAAALEPDFSGYAPLDTRSDCAGMVAALRPAALVFVKLDMWPGLSAAAKQAGVPMGMINGTVRPDSSRLRSPTRQFLRSTYARLDVAGVVGEPDARALELLGVSAERIRVTGDAAFDRALERARAAEADPWPRLPARSLERVRLLAGSTWPADEHVLLQAARDVGPRLDLVLVPHEPSDEALHRIDAECIALTGARPRRWSELNPESRPDLAAGDSAPGPSVEPLVVDAVGLLADLYLEADLALVGGAFDATGLHSVIEPAAAGLPVLFGPVHDRREADELLAAGAAEVIHEQNATDRIAALIADPARMRRMGAAARSYVEGNAGASDGGADLVSELVDRGLSRPSSA